MFPFLRRRSAEPLAQPASADYLNPANLGFNPSPSDMLAMVSPVGNAYRPTLKEGYTLPHRSLLKAVSVSAETYFLRKSVEQNYWRSVENAQKAAVQGAVVNAGMDFWGLYDATGNREKTGTTFQACRRMAQNNEVIASIIGKRVEQVAAFADRAVVRRGITTVPGYRIRLADPKAQATKEDEKRIAELEQFISECGYVPPPDSERPLGWQPGFDNFLRTLTRDALTIDHVAVRRWAAVEDRDKYPVVSYACVDAAQIRHRSREVVGVENGVRQLREFEHDRKTTDEVIRFAKVGDGGEEQELYTEREMFTAHRRPRSDENANGYGFSEIEELWTTGTLFCQARDFNGVRFSQNSLPRGMWVVFGNMAQGEFESFKLAIKQQATGVKKQMNIPVVRGIPQAGSSVQFVPVDPTPKDLEHGQSIFTYASWIHSIYQISMDETGFAATSPFRPPLSEASPETNLKYSQDTGLRPLLRWIANLLSREILWKIEPSRRYVFEFVGTGDYDEMQDIQTRTARLQAGLSTPSQEWAELDIVMPDEIKNHPAANFPAPFAVGMQMIQGIQQAEFGQQQQEQQSQLQAQQQSHAQDMEKFRMAKEGYAQDQGMPEEGEGDGQGSEEEPQNVSSRIQNGGYQAPTAGQRRIGRGDTQIQKATALESGKSLESGNWWNWGRN